jgi:serine/threonine protein kinase
MLNRRLNGSYRLEKKIGSGTFSTQTTSSPLIFGLKLIGEVFLARDFLLVQDVVIKLEPLKARQHFLEHEYHVYQKLSRIEGIPNARWFGVEGGFNAMALDCLGSSLEDLFVRCHSKFTLSTVLLHTDQLVCAFSL